MIRYIGRDGKEYILRFDMAAMEEMQERFGGMSEGLKKMSSRETEVIRDVFVILAQSGADYLAEIDGRASSEKITGEGLLTKHSSVGRLSGMMKAINEAILDGNRMQSRDEEDDKIRDGYLAELNEQEKNVSAGA